MKATTTLISCAVLLIIALHLSSCKKYYSKLLVEGTVYEFGTAKPVEGAEVLVYSQARELFNSSLSGRTEGSVITGADGKYLLDLERDDDRSYTLVARAEGFIYNSSNDERLLQDRKNKYDFKLTPQAWLKVHLKNIYPSGPGDWISITAGHRPRISGDKVDTTIYLTIQGNTKFILDGWVGKRSGNTPFQYEMYCPGHDTTFYEILY